MPVSPLPAGLRTIQPWRAIAALLLDWLLIAACFGAALAAPHPLVLAAAGILIARTQLALAVLMHDSAHGTLLRPRWLNDLAGQMLAAAPLGMSLPMYRHGHLAHHREPMTSTDPVAVIFQVNDYPVSRRELVWRLLRDLSSLGYFLSLRDFARGRFRHLPKPEQPGQPSTIVVIGSIAAIHGGMLAALWYAGNALLYPLLWLLPMLTVFQLFARIRAIAEHAGYGPDPDQTRNARSIEAPNWQTFFCGPHAIHYHIEHHAHPGVPFYRLRRVHALMRSRGELPAANLYRGYGGVLRDVSTPPYNRPTEQRQETAS